LAIRRPRSATLRTHSPPAAGSPSCAGKSCSPNELITVPEGAAAAYVELPDLSDPTTAGPFAFADPHYVTELLMSAGFRDVQLTPVHEPLIVGTDPADAVAFLQQTGMGRTTLANADPVTVGHVEAYKRHSSIT
jgi:hypothetical protein